MELEERYELDYLRDQAILEEERRIRMEAEWQEAEHYREQLPAKITVLTQIPEKHEISTDV